MQPKAELYHVSYKNYEDEIYKSIRKETYGEDIGQTSWITASEFEEFISELNIKINDHVLEVAFGSGGPAVYLTKCTGCYYTGIDINETAVINANKIAAENRLNEKMKFIHTDASSKLPFEDESFDALICIDSINHLKDRRSVLQEFYRILKTNGKVLYTDPVVITGAVTNDELAIRSSLGFFLFMPERLNEKMLHEAGFTEIHAKDATDNIISTSLRWLDAREKRKRELLKFESAEQFQNLQSFFSITHKLTNERRLSRIAYLATKGVA